MIRFCISAHTLIFFRYEENNKRNGRKCMSRARRRLQASRGQPMDRDIRKCVFRKVSTLVRRMLTITIVLLKNKTADAVFSSDRGFPCPSVTIRLKAGRKRGEMCAKELGPRILDRMVWRLFPAGGVPGSALCPVGFAPHFVAHTCQSRCFYRSLLLTLPKKLVVVLLSADRALPELLRIRR